MPAGQPVLVLEAMKMQHTVTAPTDGVVTRLGVTPGSQVGAGDVLPYKEDDPNLEPGFEATGDEDVDQVALWELGLGRKRVLSAEGKANRLATMIRGNLPMAMQGLAVVPMFVAYDPDQGAGRIFTYDVGGGPYEQYKYASIGSGSIFARSRFTWTSRVLVSPT